MSSVWKISDAATLALHMMVFLAANPGKRCSARDMASLHRISEAHLSKVLQRLVKAGLVNSLRGPKGGFELDRPANEIALLEVYEAIDGRLAPATCLLGTPICNGQGCIMGDVIEKVNNETREYLIGTTLSEVTAVYGRKSGGD